MVYTYNRVLFSLKKEILPHATTWMKLEDIILRFIISQSKRKNTIGPHLYEVLRLVKFIVIKSRIMVAKGQENGELSFNEYRD